MDEDIVRWILEYLLRKPIDDVLINTILSIFPIENSDSRLKKTLLLRRIESEASNASVSEKILEFLERIEELDHREGRSASEAMKAAYCAVAVDCTVRFLEEKVEKNSKYFETVKRIWRGRVGNMEKVRNGDGLVSQQLMRWKEDIEDAGWDPRVREKISMMNTGDEALKVIRVYLAEAWDEMGPAFLQLAAQRILEMGDFRMGETRDVEQEGDKGSDKSLNSENVCRELILYNAPVIGSAGGTGRVQDSFAANESLSGACGGGGGQEHVIVDEVAAMNKETGKGKIKHRQKRIGPHRRCSKTVAGISKGVKITEIDGMDEDPCIDRFDHLPDTPEIRGMQEALKSSACELHKVVEDPLPTALQLAEEILARNRRKNSMNEAVANGEVHVHRSHSHIDNAVEETQQKENISKDVQFNECNLEVQDDGNQNNPPRRNVKDRKLGSVVCRWDDLTDRSDGPSSTCPRLPSPISGNVSPLGNLATFEKFTRRRKRKMWSPLEEDTLRNGVKKFGVGNWKLIYNAYREIFKDRTDCDLKDKWRNLTR
ncbi:hypothetical protein Dimus_021517 [Dionaea muscipula]